MAVEEEDGMAKKRVGEIRISKRIVQIGHEVYPLANISRVQTLRLVPGGKHATYRMVNWIDLGDRAKVQSEIRAAQQFRGGRHHATLPRLPCVAR